MWTYLVVLNMSPFNLPSNTTIFWISYSSKWNYVCFCYYFRFLKVHVHFRNQQKSILNPDLSSIKRDPISWGVYFSFGFNFLFFESTWTFLITFYFWQYNITWRHLPTLGCRAPHSSRCNKTCIPAKVYLTSDLTKAITANLEPVCMSMVTANLKSCGIVVISF